MRALLYPEGALSPAVFVTILSGGTFHQEARVACVNVLAAFVANQQFSSVFQNIPPDLSQCVCVIEQALSVRALQELVTAAGSETEEGIRTPVLLDRQLDFNSWLSCLLVLPAGLCVSHNTKAMSPGMVFDQQRS
ncbi:Ryanodine receptor 44F [Zootermopsis nevadensis]|uniref:Ryanodine receptor 44F n=1 Tax=Zootermopsis nevadensis TaxID=136037 RepID=A0A067RJH2_ZOONE|nr:Ryanodine receptor 44F [Zootermopsis nevadensis]